MIKDGTLGDFSTFGAAYVNNFKHILAVVYGGDVEAAIQAQNAQDYEELGQRLEDEGKQEAANKAAAEKALQEKIKKNPAYGLGPGDCPPNQSCADQK